VAITNIEIEITDEEYKALVRATDNAQADVAATLPSDSDYPYLLWLSENLLSLLTTIDKCRFDKA
jgi:hypothetical protein